MKKATKKTKKAKKQKKGKRFIVATLSGVLFGFICCWFASSSPDLTWPVAIQIITSRTLIGFAIGISCLAMGHWTIHGLIMGLIFSIPLAFSGLMDPNPKWGMACMFGLTVVMGMIYGFLIEVITSAVFKAKSQS